MRPSGLLTKVSFSYARGARFTLLSFIVTSSFHEAQVTLNGPASPGGRSAILQPGPGRPSGGFFLVVVNRFRKPDPDVEYPQPTADAADKAMGNQCSQCRE